MSTPETITENWDQETMLHVAQVRYPHMLSSRRCRGVLIQIMGTVKPTGTDVAPRGTKRSILSFLLSLFGEPRTQSA